MVDMAGEGTLVADMHAVGEGTLVVVEGTLVVDMPAAVEKEGMLGDMPAAAAVVGMAGTMQLVVESALHMAWAVVGMAQVVVVADMTQRLQCSTAAGQMGEHSHIAVL